MTRRASYIPSTAMPRVELLTPQEVAVSCRVTVRCITKWAASGKIPGAMKLNGIWRFLRSDFEKWLEDSTTRSAEHGTSGLRSTIGHGFNPLAPRRLKPNWTDCSDDHCRRKRADDSPTRPMASSAIAPASA
jgi:excisionase family DNA binding protein